MKNSDSSLNIGMILEWSLFSTTLTSFKSYSYINDNIIKHGNAKFLEKLTVKIAKIMCKPIPLSDELKIFYDLVQNFQNFKLSVCSSLELEEFMQQFSSEKLCDKSKFLLFKVSVAGNTNEFDNLSQQYGSFVAIHGSSMNRFYSILQYGLQLPKSNDVPGIFGFGIYLTNKLDVALHFAQAHFFGYGYFENHSIKAMAICEVVKHPNAVVYKNHSKSDGFSLNNDFPPEYFLVKDESMVRVTHILIESATTLSKLNCSEHKTPFYQTNFTDEFLQMVRSHWLKLIIFIYAVILIIISYFTGRSVIFSNWESSELLDFHND